MQISRLKLIDRDEYLIARCAGKMVLHVGCVDYPMMEVKCREGNLLHHKLVKSARKCVGLDLDVTGLDFLRRTMPGEEFICHSAEDLNHSKVLEGRRFDVIVAADVYEHLPNPGLFLAGASLFLAPDGILIITTPSAFSLKRFLAMSFLNVEHVHQDHTGYYSLSTLKRNCTLALLEIVNVYAFQWKNNTFKNKLAYALCSPFMLLTGNRLADELALEIKPHL
jgi:2-polyprenyl-3-methyl-5-hydroxy-6-metoxy-1,4-benzoquinol methylase